MAIDVTIFRSNAKTGDIDPVTIIIEGKTSHCTKPCPFDGGPTFRVGIGLGETVICTGISLSGTTLKQRKPLPADTDNFPECGFPTPETVAEYQASHRGSSPESAG